jgi:hypothetical protein
MRLKTLSQSSLKLFLFGLIQFLIFSFDPQAFCQDTTMVLDSIAPAPPTIVVAMDTPYDRGRSITVNWEKSIDDGGGAYDVTGYEIMRATEVDGEYKVIGTTTAGAQYFIDNDVQDKVNYFYQIRVTDGTNTSSSAPSQPAMSRPQWLNLRRANIFVFAAILTFAILYFINRAKGGKELFIRKIAGLDAVDDAVGRATEMGRKIYYIPGISDMDNMQTIAGLTILGRVAKVAAQYEARLEVPVARSMVMVTAREVMKEGYSNAGRPDAFNEDLVYYITDDQFGYAAALDGLFVREKPAAIFFQGQFYAESLILAETGNSVGAIQIAGTAAPAQIPFFIAACDFTLIGEELFAASAYLSKDPKLLGSLKGQDVGKFIFLAAILFGVILLTFEIMNIGPWFTVG